MIGPPVIIYISFTFCLFLTPARAERDGKSLLSSFPFNHNKHHEHQHPHGDHEGASSDALDGRDSRQGYGGEDDLDPVSFDEISTGEDDADGKEEADYCY